MVILPLSASTASLNVKIIIASIRISVPSSAGLEEERLGLVSSPVVKLKAVAVSYTHLTLPTKA